MKPPELAHLPVTPYWSSGRGERRDVALGTITRLSRNLSDHPYPPVQVAAQQGGRGIAAGQPAAPASVDSAATTDAIITQAVRSGFDSPGLIEVDLEGIDELERDYLAERRLTTGGEARRLVMLGDESLAFVLGEEDHLRIVTLAPDIAAADTIARALDVDRALERSLNFAVAIDWGYLSTQITNIGTGLSTSVYLHLPALDALGKVDALSSGLANSGVELVADPFLTPPPRERAVGSIYQLRNRFALGTDEDSIGANLEAYATKLVHYERVARDELSAQKEVAEAIAGSPEEIRSARSLDLAEAMTLLSRIRLGVMCGLIAGRSLQAVTSLFFLSLRSHLLFWAQGDDNRVRGEEKIGAARATLIRRVLNLS
jgi:protein arginine kinase